MKEKNFNRTIKELKFGLLNYYIGGVGYFNRTIKELKFGSMTQRNTRERF